MLDTLVLLPGFISFFQQADHHSSSPGKLAITFLAFGKFPFSYHHCISTSPIYWCILIPLIFLTDSIPWCSFESSFCAEPSLFHCHAYITAVEQYNFRGGKHNYLTASTFSLIYTNDVQSYYISICQITLELHGFVFHNVVLPLMLFM